MKKPSKKKMPLLEWYRAITVLHPGLVLLARVGDRYETFDEAVRTAATVLGLPLTVRDGAATATFPAAEVSGHIRRLLAAGRRVATTEPPQGEKR